MEWIIITMCKIIRSTLSLLLSSPPPSLSFSLSFSHALPPSLPSSPTLSPSLSHFLTTSSLSRSLLPPPPPLYPEYEPHADVGAPRAFLEHLGSVFLAGVGFRVYLLVFLSSYSAVSLPPLPYHHQSLNPRRDAGRSSREGETE